ncbi:MAG: hypothetical protein WBD12_01355, partial [Candidatus Omnitrophota bacterium]
ITLQAFWSIVSYGPAFWMFFGQYVGMGSVWTLIGSRNLMLAWGGFGSFLGIGLSFAGFFVFGRLFYMFGKLLYSMRTRAGLERNEQWQVDPMKTMGWKKFQHMAHLSSGSLAGVFTGLTLGVTVIYLVVMVLAGFPAIQEAGGIGLVIYELAHVMRGTIPVLMGWLATTMAGVIVFISPPIVQTMMGWITVATRGLEDEESTQEALRKRIEDPRFRKLKGIGRVQIDDYTSVEGVLNVLRDYEEGLLAIRDYLKTPRGREEFAQDIRAGGLRMPFAYEVYNDLRFPADPSGADITRFRNAVEEILNEVKDIRGYTTGAVVIKPVVGVTGVILLVSAIFLWVYGWIPYGWVITSLVISSALISLKLTDLISRRVFGRPILLIGRMPLHMLGYFVRIPAMIHYFNHMIIPSFQNLQRSFFPMYSNEGYWTRGRTSVVKLNMGQKATLGTRYQQVIAWIKNQGAVLLLALILPSIAIIGLNTYYERATIKDARERVATEITIENYTEGILSLTNEQIEVLISVESARRPDMRGFMIAIADRYEGYARRGETEKARRLLNVLAIYTEDLRKTYLEQGRSKWDYEYYTQHLQQLFARLGRLSEYYKMFEIDETQVVHLNDENSTVRLIGGGEGSGVERLEDGTIVVKAMLDGRDVTGGRDSVDIVIELKEPANMLDKKELAFEVVLPETSRRTLKGNHMTVRAFDAQGNPRPIFDEPGYKGGMEAKLYFLPRPENKKGRDALDGMVVTLVSRPEMPSGIMVPGPRIYDPTTTKAWKITLHNDLVRGTSGVIQLRLVRIVPRVDMTQPVGEALVPEVAPKTEFGRSVGANILGSFHDVGEWGGKHDGYSSPEGRAKLLKQMTELAANGSGIVRVQSFFGDARAGLQFDDQGRFTGFDDKVAADIQAFFDVLEEVRWDYPN